MNDGDLSGAVFFKQYVRLFPLKVLTVVGCLKPSRLYLWVGGGKKRCFFSLSKKSTL